jgi:hypothetical protein
MAINGGSVINSLKHTINKLRITQWEPGKEANASTSVFSSVLNNAADNAKIFEVQINPDKYKKEYKIVYAVPRRLGKKATLQNFTHIDAEKLTLNFTLDGTGVIPASATDFDSLAASAVTGALDTLSRTVGLGGFTDTAYVTRRIEHLKEVVYGFNNTIHEPPAVIITWGDVKPFKGKLDDLQVTYTLFNPDGAPLRAEVQLQFSEHTESISQATGDGSVAGRGAGDIVGALLSSPDLTHRRTVKATDTLPLLCGDIYRDASFYWQVAEANNLTHFRELEVGSELLFPPIER